MTEPKIQQLISEQRLPDSFYQVVNDVYQPICTALNRQYSKQPTPTVIGINGCPGSGKSTMALFLKVMLESQYDNRVEILSIDDFYKTKRERAALATNVHPLFRTRGVPGTHDVELALNTINKLKEASHENECHIPRFDKGSDDRLSIDQWESVVQVPDFIIFEGWCVAATAQDPEELKTPINTLEQEYDLACEWRTFVNEELTGQYKTLFAQIEYLIVLQPPTPDIVLKWRIQQEEKLRESSQLTAVGMSNHQLVKFVMHYERLIRHMHQHLVPLADILVELDEDRITTELSIRN